MTDYHNQSRPSSFNRQMAYWSPQVRGAVLKNRAVEIEAWANERKLRPEVLFGIAEATMRLGRVPDMGFYGLSPDDAYAFSSFLQDVILNVAEDIDEEVQTGLSRGREGYGIVSKIATDPIGGAYLSSQTISHDGWWGVDHAILRSGGRWSKSVGNHNVGDRPGPEPSSSTIRKAHAVALRELNKSKGNYRKYKHKQWPSLNVAEDGEDKDNLDERRMRPNPRKAALDKARAKAKAARPQSGKDRRREVEKLKAALKKGKGSSKDRYKKLKAARKRKAGKEEPEKEGESKAEKLAWLKKNSASYKSDMETRKDKADADIAQRVDKEKELSPADKKKKKAKDFDTNERARMKSLSKVARGKSCGAGEKMTFGTCRKVGEGRDAGGMSSLNEKRDYRNWGATGIKDVSFDPSGAHDEDSVWLVIDGKRLLHLSKKQAEKIQSKMCSLKAEDRASFIESVIEEGRKEKMSVEGAKAAIRPVLARYSDSADPKWEKPYKGWDIQVEIRNGELIDLSYQFDADDEEEAEELDSAEWAVISKIKKDLKRVLKGAKKIDFDYSEKGFGVISVKLESLEEAALPSYVNDILYQAEKQGISVQRYHPKEFGFHGDKRLIAGFVGDVLDSHPEADIKIGRNKKNIAILSLESVDSDVSESMDRTLRSALRSADMQNIDDWVRLHNLARRTGKKLIVKGKDKWGEEVYKTVTSVEKFGVAFGDKYQKPEYVPKDKINTYAKMGLNFVVESMDRSLRGAGRRALADPQDPGAMRDYIRSVARSGKSVIDLGKKVQERFGELAGMFNLNDPFKFWTESSDTAEALLLQKAKREKNYRVDVSFSSGWKRGHPGFKNHSSRTLDSYAGKIGIPSDQDFSHKFVLGHHVVGMDRFEDKDGQPWRYELSADGISGVITRSRGKWSVLTKRVDKFTAQGEQDEPDYEDYHHYEGKNMVTENAARKYEGKLLKGADPIPKRLWDATQGRKKIGYITAGNNTLSIGKSRKVFKSGWRIVSPVYDIKPILRAGFDVQGYGADEDGLPIWEINLSRKGKTVTEGIEEASMSGGMGAFVSHFQNVMQRTQNQLKSDDETQKGKVSAPWAYQGDKSPVRRPPGGPGSSGSVAFRKGAWTMGDLDLGESVPRGDDMSGDLDEGA